MAEFAGMERALTVMAVSLALQTVLMLAGIVGAWVAYRRTVAALQDEMRELRAKADAIALTVERAVEAVERGTDSVGAVVDDARHAVQTVGNWTGTVATALATPRTAAALGVLRGLQLVARPPRAAPPAGSRLRSVNRHGPVVRARLGSAAAVADHGPARAVARRHRVCAKKQGRSRAWMRPGSHVRRPAGGQVSPAARCASGLGPAAAGGDARVTEHCPQRQPAIGSTR